MGILEKITEYIGNAQVASASYTPTKAYTGGLPSKIVKNGSKGTDVKHVQNFLNWCIKAGLKVDGICGKNTVAAIKKYQKKYGLTADGIFGAKSKAKAKTIIAKYAPKPAPKPKTPTKGDKIAAKAKEYAWAYGTATKVWSYKTGYAKTAYKTALKKHIKKTSKVSQSDCGYFVSTCVRASGVASKFNALAGTKQKFPAVPSTMKIVWSGKKIPSGVLQAGDIIRYKKTNGSQHTLMYIGGGKIAEAGRKIRFPIIRKDTKKYNASNVKISTLQVIRAK